MKATPELQAYLKKRDSLNTELKKHGYTLYQVTHFKKHDRIRFGNKHIKISLNLRGKLSEFALDVLVKACIGRETRQRHVWEKIGETKDKRNNIYRCKLCKEETIGHVEAALCGPDCQHEVHFCKL